MLITSESDIKNSNSVVYTKCDYCGDVTKTSYKNFMRGRKNIQKDSCTNCVGNKCAEITLIKRQNKFYEELNSKCCDNGYSLESKREDIVNNKTYIKYVCPKHGIQSMRIANFLSGKKCPECNKENASERNRYCKEDVIKLISDCGGELLNADEYINKYTKNLIIRCPLCGNPFKTSLTLFIQHGGQKCDKCFKNESIGESKIRIYLEKRSIVFKQEYWFDDCRDINPLPFDFYIPDKNTIIEFDGRQHFEETNIFSYDLNKTRLHDSIKNDYCSKNGINLIRIPYTEINNIENILEKELI